MRDYIPLTVFLTILLSFCWILNKTQNYQIQADQLNGVPPPCLAMGLCDAKDYPYLKNFKMPKIDHENDSDVGGLHYGNGAGYYLTGKGVEFKSFSYTPGLKF